MPAVATAHPNVALVKYWGKRPGPHNLPATPSLSITLAGLSTRTTVRVDPTLARDMVRLDGRVREDVKIDACLARLRARSPVPAPALAVDTTNDFPTAAGLASSASGFAALVLAVDAVLELRLDAAARADEARRASASAARSLLGGFVELTGGDDPSSWQPRQILDASEWPLDVVVAVCADTPKSVSSSEGMSRSRTSSPFYDRWLATTQADFAEVRSHVLARDFEALAEIAEANCLAMHAVMLAARPALAYWNAATVECMARVRELRGLGVGVFFTIDAGPQVKAVCLPEARTAVAAALADVPGVARTLLASIGEGARLERAA
jgi:diphosphomevalonate decarboxylase